MNRVYAGIGSRLTPPNILSEIRGIAVWLSDEGIRLRSGGAKGADSAFYDGAIRGRAFRDTVVYLPHIWTPAGRFCRIQTRDQVAMGREEAKAHHPAWHRCSPMVKAFHIRNVAIILGGNLDKYADFVVCWTKGGRVAGGTGLGIRIARTHDIPVFNLSIGTKAVRAKIDQFLF